jgi:DNA modification methylase
VIDLRLGDCVEVMCELGDGSVDAVVCDPPYGLEFMGKDWDAPWRSGTVLHDPSTVGGFQDGSGGNAFSRSRIRFGRDEPRAFQAWCEQWASECLRVLKPGGHLLAFGGTRTYHRLACAIEDAGFEIRDCVAWLYGSGFPKSLDVSKAIDARAGVEREVVGVSPFANRGEAGGYQQRASSFTAERGDVTAPATDDARRWNGWGTALKPAHEPIVVARKPLSGTVAANVLEHGTGALNIDGCRIEANGRPARVSLGEDTDGKNTYGSNGPGGGSRAIGDTDLGRWPANVVLDEEAAELLDEQTGILVSGPESDRGHRRNADREARRNAYGGFQGQTATGVPYGDSGGASRFFYVAKASRAERNAGLDGFEEGESPYAPLGINDDAGIRARGRNPEAQSRRMANVHPTVKPVALMRWLVRLVTPPAGHILDPFLGSGTTGIAAALENLRFTGIEREPDYLNIAKARIDFWSEHGEDGLRIVAERERSEREREQIAASGQLGLLDGEVAA